MADQNRTVRVTAEARARRLDRLNKELNKLRRDLEKLGATETEHEVSVALDELQEARRLVGKVQEDAGRGAYFYLGWNGDDVKRLEDLMASLTEREHNISIQVHAEQAKDQVDQVEKKLAVLRARKAGIDDEDLSSSIAELRSIDRAAAAAVRNLSVLEAKFGDIGTSAASGRFKEFRQEVRVEVNDRQAIANLNNIESEISNLTSRVREIRMSGDAKMAFVVINQLQRELESIARRTHRFYIKGEIDESAYSRVRQMLADLQGERARVEIEISEEVAKQELSSFQRLLVRLGLSKVTVEVDAETGQAIAKMKAAGVAARVLGTDLRGGLYESVKTTNSILILLGRALIFVALSGIGPLTAAATLAGAALASLGAAFAFVLAGALPTITALANHETASNQLEAANKSLESATVSYEDALRSQAQTQRDAADSVEDATEAYREAVAAIGQARAESAKGIQDAVRSYNDALRSQAETDRSTRQQVADARQAYSAAVQDYAKAEADAQEMVADAVRNLRDAERELVEARRDAARSIQDAYRSYMDSLKDLRDTERDVAQANADAWRSYQDALQGIKDAQRDAAESIARAQQQVVESTRGIRDAEEELAEARARVIQMSAGVREAEAALRQARATERFRILEMELDVADARLRQRQIALDIAEAERRLQQMRSSTGSVVTYLEMAERALAKARSQNDPEDILRAEQALKVAREQSAEVGDLERRYMEQRRAVDQSDIRKAELDLARARLEQQQNNLRLIESERDLRDARVNGTRELQSAIEALSRAHESYRDALQGVRDAEEGLGDARRERIQAVRDLRRTEAEAARSIAEAQRAAGEAYRGYVQTVRDGAESIRDAQRQVSDQYQAYKQAQVEGAEQIRDAERRVAEARRAVGEAAADGAEQVAAAYARMQDAARGVREAERDRRLQMQDAARAVVEAERGIAEARRTGARQVAEAQKAAAEALETLRETQVSASESMADAHRQVRQAAEALRDAQKEAGEAADAAGAKLTASQRALLRAWESFRTEYGKVMKDANDKLNYLGVDILAFAETYLPLLGSIASRTASAMQRSFDHLKNVLRSPEVDAALNRFLNSIPGIANKAGNTIGNLVGLLLIVLGEATPHVRAFFGWLEDITGEWLRWAESKKGREEIAKWLKDGAEFAEDLKDILGNLWDSLVNIAENKNTQEFFDSMMDFLGYIAKHADDIQILINGLNGLVNYIDRLPEPVKRLLLGAIVVGFTFQLIGLGIMLSGLLGVARKGWLAVAALKAMWTWAGKVNKQKVAPAVAGGGAVKPVTVPVMPDTTTKAGGTFLSRVGTFLARLPIIRTILPFATRIGAGLLAGLRAFLFGPLGIVLLITDLFTGGSVTKGFTRAIGDFIRGFKEAWRESKDESLPRQIADSILTGIASMFRFGKIIDKFKKGFADGFKEGDKSWLRRVVSGILEGIVQAMKELPLAGPFIEWLDKAITKVLDWLGIKSPSTRAKKLIGAPIASGVLKGIVDFDFITGWIKKINKFFDNAKNAWDKKGWSGLGSFALKTIGNAIRDYNLLGPWSDKIGKFFQNASENWKKKRWSGLGSYVFDQIGNAIKRYNLLGPWSDKIGDFFNNASDALKRKGWSGLGSYIMGAIKGAISSYGSIGLVDRLSRAYSDLRNYLFDGKWNNIGWDIVRGIADGVMSAGGILQKAIQWIANNAPGWAKNILGISSPSKVFRKEIGLEIPRGAAMGVDDGIPMLERSVRKMADRTTKAFGGGKVFEVEARVKQAEAIDAASVGLQNVVGLELRRLDVMERQLSVQQSLARERMREHRVSVATSNGGWSPPNVAGGGRVAVATGGSSGGGGAAATATSSGLNVNIQMGSITVNGVSEEEFKKAIREEADRAAEEMWRELTKKFSSGGGPSGRGI